MGLGLSNRKIAKVKDRGRKHGFPMVRARRTARRVLRPRIEPAVEREHIDIGRKTGQSFRRSFYLAPPRQKRQYAAMIFSERLAHGRRHGVLQPTFPRPAEVTRHDLEHPAFRADNRRVA